jgi:hypothetical protein
MRKRQAGVRRQLWRPRHSLPANHRATGSSPILHRRAGAPPSYAHPELSLRVWDSWQGAGAKRRWQMQCFRSGLRPSLARRYLYAGAVAALCSRSPLKSLSPMKAASASACPVSLVASRLSPRRRWGGLPRFISMTRFPPVATWHAHARSRSVAFPRTCRPTGAPMSMPVWIWPF